MEQDVHVVGVDIGGTTTKAVAATATGGVLSDVRNPTQRGRREVILEGVLETVGQAIDLQHGGEVRTSAAGPIRVA